MTDQFTGIFDDITPDQFHSRNDAAAFDTFVTRNIDTVRWAWLATDGNLVNPVATLVHEGVAHSFIPAHDETLGAFITRLHGEAEAMDAQWLFIARRTLVGASFAPIDEVQDVAISDEAEAAGQLVEGVYFYGERINNGARHYRHGIMRPDANDRLGDPLEGNELQSFEAFARILS